MPDLQQMSRLLYCHNWDRVEHWAAAVHQLADLSDGDITKLPALGGGEFAAAPSRPRRWISLERMVRNITRALGSPRTS